MLTRFCVALIFVAAGTSPSLAKSYKQLFQERTYNNSEVQTFLESLDYQQGVVTIAAANVRLRVPDQFYFLKADDARRVLIEQWRNPPNTAQAVLGMILPSSATPVDDTWGAVISFDADGYVSDEDAEKINYDDLLKNMQAGTSEANEERVKQGFSSIRLVGWAQAPFYDKATHKLHWAKELEFGGNPNHTLNYDVRALGRKGVLKMNFVAGIGELTAIKRIIPTVMAMPEFEEGSRYQDFVPSVDKVAAYGIGGLIAGKVLSKVGFLAVALVFLKKGWILVVMAIAGLFSGLKRLFGGGAKPQA